MFQGWWVVATHFVVQLCVVGFYTYGLPLFVPVVIEEFSTDVETINRLFAVQVTFGAIVTLVAGPLVDRWSARGLLLIGVASLVAGLVALSLATSAMAFVLLGGFFLGLTGPLCGPMTGSAVVSRWFTASRGRALGFAAIGTSAGGVLVPFLLSIGIEAWGWRFSMQAFAVVVCLVAFPLLLLRFWNRPADVGAVPEPMPGQSDAPPPGSEAAMTVPEILRAPSFWLLTLSLAAFITSYAAPLANIAQFWADVGLPAEYNGRLLPLLAASGICGKLGFGALADRIPLKVAFIAAIGATATALAILTFEPGLPGLALSAIVLGFASGGLLPVWSALVPRLFGVASFGRAMGLMGPVISLASVTGFAVIGRVRDATGSYVPAYQGFVVVLLVAALIVLPLRVGTAEGAR